MALNMYGMIDLDQMAKLLNEMMDRINQQDNIIQSLANSVGILVSRSKFDSSILQLENQISALKNRLDIIEPSVSVFYNDKRFEMFEFRTCVIWIPVSFS